MKGTLFLLLFPVFVFGQTYTSKLIDKATNEPIIYANIGILNKKKGTVSDLKGQFTLNLDKTIKETDTLRISMIGYATRDFLVKDFKKVSKQIYLEQTNYELDEVIVIPKNYITKRVGNTKRRENIMVSFENNNMGHEMGVLMKIKKRPTFIEKVYVNIVDCTYDSIFYRMNIYEYDRKAKKPGKNVLRKPIYLSYTKDEITETLEVDLSHLNVYVENDFVVTMELVKDLGEGDINFSANFRIKGFYRYASQSDWKKAPISIGPGIWAIIKQEK